MEAIFIFVNRKVKEIRLAYSVIILLFTENSSTVFDHTQSIFLLRRTLPRIINS